MSAASVDASILGTRRANLKLLSLSPAFSPLSGARAHTHACLTPVTSPPPFNRLMKRASRVLWMPAEHSSDMASQRSGCLLSALSCSGQTRDQQQPPFNARTHTLTHTLWLFLKTWETFGVDRPCQGVNTKPHTKAIMLTSDVLCSSQFALLTLHKTSIAVIRFN